MACARGREVPVGCLVDADRGWMQIRSEFTRGQFGFAEFAANSA